MPLFFVYGQLKQNTFNLRSICVHYMSPPKLPQKHSATKAIDELFKTLNTNRVGKPTSPYVSSDYPGSDEYTYYHFRIHVKYDGNIKDIDGKFYTTSHGTIYVEEVNESDILVIVDTKAESKSEHPAYSN